MKLKARKKSTENAPDGLSRDVISDDVNREDSAELMIEVLPIRLNEVLYNTIRNSIIASHAALDFTHTSVADVVRNALQAYKDGMEPVELAQEGKKVATTVRVSAELKEFYDNMPNRMRTKLVERAVRTYLKNK